ncbi:MAG: hypothetical protein EOO73_23520 [Myxococcales bacterium]|nr:MAG: hypothetical protein EOO73_23520 [Myxococcales bacterium]
MSGSYLLTSYTVYAASSACAGAGVRERVEIAASSSTTGVLSTVVGVTGSEAARFSVSYATGGHVMSRSKLCGDASSAPFDYSATASSFSLFAAGACGPVVLQYTKQP